MSRQEKRSRIRMLPPRVQLQQRDALTGSYPTNVRFSTDGRFGNYPIKFDDIYTVPFVSSDQYIPSIGFPVDNIWLTNSQSNDLTGSIVTTGNIRSQVIEGLPFFHFTPGQDITPFRDNSQPAADGKSSKDPFYVTGSSIVDVGEGFANPVWSKDKIEIDISVSEDSALRVNFLTDPITGKSNSYLMGYYNFDQKKWEGIGQGYNVTDKPFRSGSKNYSDLNICYGFSPSALVPWDSRGNGEPGGYNLLDRGGLPIRDFGFPFDARYHATSSQTLKMSNYITEPFLLEKIVVEYSASFNPLNNFWPNYTVATRAKTNTLGTLLGTSNYNFIPSHINTFFLLNQRKNMKYSTPAAGVYGGISNIPTTTQLTFGGSNTYVNTGRDIITFLNMACYNPRPYSKNTITQINFNAVPMWPENGGAELYGKNVDLKVIDDNVSSSIGPLVCAFGVAADVPSKFIMSGSVKSGNLFPAFFSSVNNSNDMILSFLKQPKHVGVGPILVTNSHNPFAIQYGTSLPQRTTYMTSGRNGLGIKLTNRDLINPLDTVKYTTAKSYSEAGSNGTRQLIHPNYSVKYFDNETLFKTNPYLLLPTDELIVGWQLPAMVGSVEDNADPSDGYQITFKTGDAKITLYGCYLRKGREYDDGLNQLLSSDNIHEVIGE